MGGKRMCKTMVHGGEREKEEGCTTGCAVAHECYGEYQKKERKNEIEEEGGGRKREEGG